MTRDILIGIVALGVGGLFAVHCPRAALIELRSGRVRGRVNTFRRDRDPIAFWLTIGATALAGLIGLLFTIYGLVLLGFAGGLIG